MHGFWQMCEIGQDCVRGRGATSSKVTWSTDVIDMFKTRMGNKREFRF